ncbi:hypothetical protein K9M16_02400 [Candidatus Babeliales bacterium]|nr:hypothetical protein [Candidatus Babeliales bacterium]
MNSNIQNKIDTLTTSTKFSGNIIFFYAIDIGDEIDLLKIKQRSLVKVRSVPLSPYFKDYHIPLNYSLPNSKYCISSDIHQFGVLSFCYRIPFENSFEELKLKVIDIKSEFDQVNKKDIKFVFDAVYSAIKKPHFYNLDNFYYTVQIEPIKGVSPQEFKDKFGSSIASLLRLETQILSKYQKNEILSATTGYSGEDMIIIDSEASFVYDKEYFEPLEFLSFANIQQLELQYFDRILDQKLNHYYKQQSYKVPWLAYIPLLSQQLNLPISQLIALQVDISVITERLENSIKMVGDSYFTHLYSIISKQLSLAEWHQSIKKKMGIINEFYNFYQDRLDIIHEEILTIVVIILIGFEAVLMFIK